MAEARATFWRRNRWLLWVGGGLLMAVAGLAIAVTVLAHRAEPYLRARIVEGLQQRFHARVELDSFHVSFAHGSQGRWGIYAEGHGLRIWPPAQAQTQLETTEQAASTESAVGDDPLIGVEAFRFHAPLRFERGKPIVISMVQIEGLDIDVPPRKHDARASGAKSGAADPNGTGPGAIEPGDSGKDAGVLSDVLVERVECNRAELLLETDKLGKLPLGFAIAHLTLTNLTADDPVGFEADLTNPRPLGDIHTTGNFGPWQVGDPGESPVSGDYQFDHADLSNFKGIAGILNSTGRYRGTLRNIVVDGDTDTPDFRLTYADNPMPLHTHFHATVDGTDGDTRLEPVDAKLGQSHFTVQGQVVRLKTPNSQDVSEKQSGNMQAGSVMEKASPFRGGHDIVLTMNVDRARIEDFLRLASRGSTPLLTGAVKVKSTLHILPGDTPVLQRLSLKGVFTLDQAQFTSAKVQGDIKQLSLRGQGRPKDVKTTDPASIDSTMQGNFQMTSGVITLPALTYTVPGATIEMKGTYEVDGGALDFMGNVKMQAMVSQMVGGWKGLLLTPLDPYLKRDGAGTEIPIHIRGTREQPDFGIDFDRMKRRSGGKSDEKQ